MIPLVADTHAVVWYFEASSKLSSTAFKTMQSTIQAEKPIYISSISMVEIVYLTEKGRLPQKLFEQITQVLQQENQLFVEIPFNLGMAKTLRKIPANIVPDMPDRMIAATALHLNLPLITCDQKIRAAPLVTIWLNNTLTRSLNLGIASQVGVDFMYTSDQLLAQGVSLAAFK